MTKATKDSGKLALEQTSRWQRRVGGQKDTLIDDIRGAIIAWPLWITLGGNDIRQRYRRSVLGPIWITLSMGLVVGTMGILYSQVFHMDVHTYLPFLTLGFVIWGFISTTVNESCLAFRENESIIKQIKVPYSVHMMRVMWRNVIVFLHTAIIFIPVALLFRIAPGFVCLLAVPGFILLFFNSMWLGLVVAILSTRFHDVPLIVVNVLQLLFFATPILWPANNLGKNTLVADVNPVYHLIELVRGPLLGQTPALLSWIVAVALLVAGWLGATALYGRVSRRIVYWL